MTSIPMTLSTPLSRRSWAQVLSSWRCGWSVATTFEDKFSNVMRSYAGKGVIRPM